MKVNLMNLQRQTIESYNALVELLNEKVTNRDHISIDKYDLSEALTDLHNCLAGVGSLMNENGESYLDGEENQITEFIYEV